MKAQRRDRPPGFEATTPRTLRAAGLVGPRFRATFDQGVLTFEGSEGGRIEIAPGQVERVRFSRSFGDTKVSGFLTARIWRWGASPLILAVMRGETVGYADTMKAFASAIAGAGGLNRIEIGRQPFYAYGVAPLGFLVFAYFAVDIGRGAWASGDGWDWMLAGLLGLMAVFTPQAIVNIQPRSVDSLDAIDRELHL